MFKTLISIPGIEVLSKENITTELPKNINVASPAERPNIVSCLFVYPISTAFEANMLVQNTIVKGLDIVKRKAEIKLLK